MNRKKPPIILWDEIEKPKEGKDYKTHIDLYFDLPVPLEQQFKITSACWCKHKEPSFTRSRMINKKP